MKHTNSKINKMDYYYPPHIWRLIKSYSFDYESYWKKKLSESFTKKLNHKTKLQLFKSKKINKNIGLHDLKTSYFNSACYLHKENLYKQYYFTVFNKTELRIIFEKKQTNIIRDDREYLYN